MTALSFVRRHAAALAALLALAGSGPAAAQQTTAGNYNSMYAGIGAKGYDVVAYFTQSKPVPGNADFTAEHGGVTWRFSSAQNRDAFKASPARYAPQFGGFCSWGVAQGKLFDVDPVNGWKIVDGKLYMNFNADIQNAWEKDIPGFLRTATTNWPKLNR